MFCFGRDFIISCLTESCHLVSNPVFSKRIRNRTTNSLLTSFYIVVFFFFFFFFIDLTLSCLIFLQDHGLVSNLVFSDIDGGVHWCGPDDNDGTDRCVTEDLSAGGSWHRGEGQSAWGCIASLGSTGLNGEWICASCQRS